MRTVIISIIVVLVLFIGAGYAQNVRKTPYLIYTGVDSTMDILWQLSGARIDTVSYGADTLLTGGTAVNIEYGNDHQHRHTLRHLLPGSLYRYKVVSGDSTYSGSFRSAPVQTDTALEFFAYGDTRSHPEVHDMVASAMLRAVDSDAAAQTIVLSVGDLVLDGNEESFWDNDFFNPAYHGIRAMLGNMPYQSARGNHDGPHEGEAALFNKYFPYPVMGSSYWSFDYGPAHFVMLDQYVKYDSASEQFLWLDSDLGSSKKPWKFIVLHEPGWTAGGDHKNSVPVQKYIEPLCEKYDVSIVFGGHNHYYARADVPAADGHIIYHITTGGGGAPMYTPDSTQPHIVACASQSHYCRIKIAGNTHLEFQAVNIKDDVIDKFVVDRKWDTSTKLEKRIKPEKRVKKKEHGNK